MMMRSDAYASGLIEERELMLYLINLPSRTVSFNIRAPTKQSIVVSMNCVERLLVLAQSSLI